MKFLFLTLSFAFVAGFALLKPGFPPTHDGEYHIIRFYQFDKTLRGGDFYPRWQPDTNRGYGSPLFNYYYPLPNYLASFFHFFGISFIDAFKFQIVLAILLGALFMYLWAGGKWGGLVASIFYTYSPYHLLDIYIRGAVGEIWALAFFPGFLWSITKFIKEKRRIFMPISVIFFALVIFSNNILALLFLTFALSYIVFIVAKTKKQLILCVLSLLLALGLTGIFWLPALFERSFVQGLENFDYRQHFVELYQLIFPSWGSGFSADVATEGLSFQIGVANLIALILSIFLIFKKRRNIRSMFFLCWVAVSIFIMFRVSLPLWDSLPLLRYVQFPWRFLSVVILCCAMLAGSVTYFWQKRLLASSLIFLAIILGIGYSKPAYYHPREDSYYTTRESFIDGTNVPGNAFNTIWMNRNLKRKEEKLELLKGEALIEEQIVRPTYYNSLINAKTTVDLLINTAYFPGWTAFIDGRKINLTPNKDGLISFSVPDGKHTIEVSMLDTPIRATGKAISLFSLLITLILFIKSIRVRISQ